MQLSPGDFQESSVTFENRQVIFENLWKSLGDLWHSLVIFRSLRANFGNFLNILNDLRKLLGFSMFLQTNFENQSVVTCTGVTLELHCSNIANEN